MRALGHLLIWASRFFRTTSSPQCGQGTSTSAIFFSQAFAWKGSDEGKKAFPQRSQKTYTWESQKSERREEVEGESKEGETQADKHVQGATKARCD